MAPPHKRLSRPAIAAGVGLLSLMWWKEPVVGTAWAVELVHVQLGALTALVDRKDWSFEVKGDDRLVLSPASSESEDLEPVELVRVKNAGASSCEALVRAELPQTLYNDFNTEPALLSGVPAVRAEARTRCRNLTPKGIAICAALGQDVYLVVSRIETCQRGPGSAVADGSPIDKILRVLRVAR